MHVIVVHNYYARNAVHVRLSNANKLFLLAYLFTYQNSNFTGTFKIKSERKRKIEIEIAEKELSLIQGSVYLELPSDPCLLITSALYQQMTLFIFPTTSFSR